MDTGDQSSYVEHTSLVLKDLQVVETICKKNTCYEVLTVHRENFRIIIKTVVSAVNNKQI